LGALLDLFTGLWRMLYKRAGQEWFRSVAQLLAAPVSDAGADQ